MPRTSPTRRRAYRISLGPEGVATALRLLGEDVAAALMDLEQYAEDAE